MADTELNPYIYFKGNAREAMEFYKSVFGGELSLQLYKDEPDAIPGGVNPANENRVMHAALRGGAATILASDSDNASDEAKKIELSLTSTDEAKMREIFDKLSAGGKVDQPLEKMFWGDIFGHLTDKFGVIWMIDVLSPENAATMA